MCISFDLKLYPFSQHAKIEKGFKDVNVVEHNPSPVLWSGTGFTFIDYPKI